MRANGMRAKYDREPASLMRRNMQTGKQQKFASSQAGKPRCSRRSLLCDYVQTSTGHTCGSRA